MPFTTKVLRYNSNTRQLEAAGDLIIAIFDLTIDFSGPNNYPAGGEPIDFSTEFKEVHSVIPSVIGGTSDNVAMIAFFERDADPVVGLTAGKILFYQSADGINLFPELLAAQYPANFAFSITVFGRPSSDAA